MMTPSPHLLADIDNVPLRICSRYRRCFLLHSFLLLLFCFFFLLSSCKLHISNKHSNLRTYVQLQLQKLANVCLFLNIFHTHLPSFFLLVLPLSLYLFSIQYNPYFFVLSLSHTHTHTHSLNANSRYNLA